MAENRPKNYPKLKNYQPTKFMLPTSHYDEDKADRAVMFIENLRHTKGKWSGKRFWLLPWQEQIVRDVFGVVKDDGNRQFRTAYVEIGKKNGKSELAAAVALYLLYAIIDGIIKNGFWSVIGTIVMLVIVIGIVGAIVGGLGELILEIVVMVVGYALMIISAVLEWAADLCERSYAKFLKAIISRLDKC